MKKNIFLPKIFLENFPRFVRVTFRIWRVFSSVCDLEWKMGVRVPEEKCLDGIVTIDLKIVLNVSLNMHIYQIEFE